MSTPPLEIPALVENGIRDLKRATVVLYVVLISLSLYFWHDARETKRAVCAFRSDLQARIDASESYLADHPNGVFGLSAAQLQSSIDGQRRTVASLASAGC